ncbi:GM19005 [Drosophila sechellia]|uniref:GM19005 n=1 Tax=Drosophila sechellia TaxID=7238 RepID=B4I986_DROSE|nr:GM19005 [Drosophila sechellia]
MSEPRESGDPKPPKTAEHQKDPPQKEAAADFEAAIDAAGFGMFNILLLVAAVPAAMSTVYETSTMSYILPSAECDLKLSLLDKGILNAITYAGMISSAVLWGYLADTKGRRNLLIVGYAADTICVLGGAFSQMTSWQFFVAITALPSLLSFVLFFFFPESPKFLMSKGRNREALDAFKFMYHLNSRKPKDSFPIKLLANEVIVPVKKHAKKETIPTEVKLPTECVEVQDPENQDSKKSSLRSGFTQLRPLFTKPYLGLSLWVYLLNFCVLLGQNTMRLWLPQLFASINEYENLMSGESQSTSICNILEYSVNRTQIQLEAVSLNDPTVECRVNITASTYTNNLIVAGAGLVAYMLAGFLVNLVGVKLIMTSGLLVAGGCSIGMYWSSSAASTVALASLFVTMGSISATSVISASVSLFPTSLRTMIVSLEMMFGRLGSLLGNIFFPALMGLGCVPPFLMISAFMLAGCFMAAFLPLKNKAALSWRPLASYLREEALIYECALKPNGNANYLTTEALNSKFGGSGQQGRLWRPVF